MISWMPPVVRRLPQAACAYISRELSGKAHRHHAAAQQPELSAVIVNNPGIGDDDLNGVTQRPATRFPAQRSMERSGMMRCFWPEVVPSSEFASSEFETIPDQRCTAARCTASGKRCVSGAADYAFG
jgi:hypothetical protein